jgi:hypothetical protein
MVIALEADVFFWVVGEIACLCSLGRAVFRLFGDTDFNLTTHTVRGGVGEETDSLIFTGSNDTGELLFFAALPGRMQTTKVVRMPVP